MCNMYNDFDYLNRLMSYKENCSYLIALMYFLWLSFMIKCGVELKVYGDCMQIVSSFTIDKVGHFLFDRSLTDTNCIFEAHRSNNKCLSTKQIFRHFYFCSLPPLEIEVHVLHVYNIQINRFHLIRSLHGN